MMERTDHPMNPIFLPPKFFYLSNQPPCPVKSLGMGRGMAE